MTDLVRQMWVVLDLWNADDWGLWVAGVYDDEDAAKKYVEFYGSDNRHKIVCVPLNPALNSTWREAMFTLVSRNERLSDIVAVK